MAKQPKKPAAKKSTATKPVKSKPAAKKNATKQAEAAAQKRAAKKAVAPKPTAKKSAAKSTPAKKQPATKISAAKPPATKKAVRKTSPVRVPVELVADTIRGSLAAPNITAPTNGGTVSANTDLTVSVLTNRTDLAYIVTVTKLGSPPTVVATINISTPTTSPCQATVPGSALVGSSTFTILIAVDPISGSTPPHNFDEITVTTP